MDRDDITCELTVNQLLRRRPAAAAVFVRRGMACVGCSMAPFETLVEVASVYGQEPSGFLAELAGVSGAAQSAGAPDEPATTRPRAKRPKGR
jgi:hybrid cluster-associated redox disulfide protein